MLCLVTDLKNSKFTSTMWTFIPVILFYGSLVSARDFRVCQLPSVNVKSCENLKKGNSEVKCVSVSDGADCTLKLIKNEVDFGVFTADELFLAYQFYPNGIRLHYQLRHNQKQSDEFQTQMVAVVSPSYTGDNFNSLKNGGLCHPGFLESQLLNDKILKQFERTVYGKECKNDLTDSENELLNLKNFFGKSCRPGAWVPNKTLDESLKRRYPELCSLCDNESSCSYNDKYDHGHIGALKCLRENKGKVAYVALSHVQEYMDAYPSRVPIFQMLCTNGTVMPLNVQNPCSWIRRSWDVIASREDVSLELPNKLHNWLTYGEDGWTQALKEILLGKEFVPVKLQQHTTPGSYLGQNGGASSLDPPDNPKCGKEMRWCTTNDLEKNKCQWVANEAAALGITPKIVCEKSHSTFECLRSISENKVDLMTIDSNYGYVARKLFGLSTVLYADNDIDKSNVVLAVIKDTSAFNFSSLQDLKGKKACFPEYGGISWMSFLNIVRTNNLNEDKKTCDFKKVASDILHKACVPGIQDTDYSLLQRSSKANVTALCALCPRNNCAANDGNSFFRDNGAFRCIEYGIADIAFIKPKNLNDSTAIVNQHEYRVLCKNGSLAHQTGFDVDENCAWSITIDSEIVSRKDISNVDHSNMALALLKLNMWLGSNLQTPINIYKSFNNTRDLLFKDSTVGLESSTSVVRSVTAYKKLMMDAEECSSASTLSFISLLILLLSQVFNRVL